MIPTYDWKYIVCPPGEPAWHEFGECGVFATQPVSNRDFDPTRVAEAIAEDLGTEDDVLLCMEDPHGNRYEVGVNETKVSQYTSTGCKTLGKTA